MGEVGILQQVLLNDLMNTRIFLFVDYNGFRYMGSLHFDEPQFCSKIFAVLNAHIGYSMKEMGDLNLSHTL